MSKRSNEEQRRLQGGGPESSLQGTAHLSPIRLTLPRSPDSRQVGCLQRHIHRLLNACVWFRRERIRPRLPWIMNGSFDLILTKTEASNKKGPTAICRKPLILLVPRRRIELRTRGFSVQLGKDLIFSIVLTK